MNRPIEQFYIDSGNPVRNRFEKVSLTLGLLGLGACLTGYFVDAHRFFHSYLTAFAFWITLALGGLFFVMIHHLTSATWSVVMRRMAESLMSVLPYLAILFIPLIFGIGDLYHWSHPDEVALDPLLEHKAPYLNLGFFLLRALVYFAVWSAMAIILYRTSLSQDRSYRPEGAARMKKVSAAGMIIFALSLTFASFDWLMSQDYHWYSTIFGVCIFSGGLVSALAMLTYVSVTLNKNGILAEVITKEHYHDLGKLTFAFVVFWAYVAFSQYFLIWYANIPEETVWFAARYRGGWRVVSLILVFGYFVIPFTLLISRGMKRKISFMKGMALWLLLMHYVDIYWVVMPNYSKNYAMFNWMDIASMLGIGGIFMWLFWRRFLKNALVPVNDPRLEASIEFTS